MHDLFGVRLIWWGHHSWTPIYRTILFHLAARPIHPAGRGERSCEASRTCGVPRSLHQGLRWRQLCRSQGRSRPLGRACQHDEHHTETMNSRERMICSIWGSSSSDGVRRRAFLSRVAMVLLLVAAGRISSGSIAGD